MTARRLEIENGARCKNWEELDFGAYINIARHLAQLLSECTLGAAMVNACRSGWSGVYLQCAVKALFAATPCVWDKSQVKIQPRKDFVGGAEIAIFTRHTKRVTILLAESRHGRATDYGLVEQKHLRRMACLIWQGRGFMSLVHRWTREKLSTRRRTRYAAPASHVKLNRASSTEVV